ncbi:MAG: histidine kinase [Bacteroidales bacterium]|nr:histidine kinase [Bacteroidales bacterium]
MKKSVFYFLHALVILFFVYQCISNLKSVSVYYKEPLSTAILDGVCVWGSILGLIYVSYWVFTPKYLVKKEYLKFIISTISIVFGFVLFINAAGFFISHILKVKTHTFDSGWVFGIAAGWAFFFGLVGTLLRLFIKWIQDSQYKAELEKQNLRSELSLLKNQINPHFLFNSLNNIDSLIDDTSPNASRALGKLSDIMRYMVYDSEKEFVPLQNEISYIKNYIDLQKLRIPNQEIIKLSINGDISQQQIAPMLFIPFVENAFKHSSMKDKPDNCIKIKFEIAEKKIRFHCYNTKKEIVKDESSGIGLENVKRRLELLYNDMHKLEISNSDKSFSVYLDINL